MAGKLSQSWSRVRESECQVQVKRSVMQADWYKQYFALREAVCTSVLWLIGKWEWWAASRNCMLGLLGDVVRLKLWKGVPPVRKGGKQNSGSWHCFINLCSSKKRRYYKPHHFHAVLEGVCSLFAHSAALKCLLKWCYLFHSVIAASFISADNSILERSNINAFVKKKEPQIGSFCVK